jgi:hypothetical protein
VTAVDALAELAAHQLAGLPRPLGSETRTSCRDLVVLVNQAAEAIPAPNPHGGRDPARRHPDVGTPRRPKRKASVRPVGCANSYMAAEQPVRERALIWCISATRLRRFPTCSQSSPTSHCAAPSRRSRSWPVATPPRTWRSWCCATSSPSCVAKFHGPGFEPTDRALLAAISRVLPRSSPRRYRAGTAT